MDVVGLEWPWEDLNGGDDALPLPVVPDWDAQVRRATILCRVIDRHLDHEARDRLLASETDFQPRHLCPEQRVRLVTDLSATVIPERS